MQFELSLTKYDIIWHNPLETYEVPEGAHMAPMKPASPPGEPLYAPIQRNACRNTLIFSKMHTQSSFHNHGADQGTS